MATWGAVGFTISVVAGIIDPDVIDTGEGPVDLARIMGPVGAASGIVFGLLLVIGERGKAVADIRLLRAVMWGVVAAAMIRLLTGLTDAVLWNVVVLGALSGAVCVALARTTHRHVGARQVRKALP